MLDGARNDPHSSGIWTLRTGTAPERYDEVDAPSFDVIISNAIGTGTRFRSLEIAATGKPKDSYSRQSKDVINPSAESPLALYTRIFGSDFQDPNSAQFKPDPQVMVRRSVLSGVSEQRQTLMRNLGPVDRQRMDQYFTSIRHIENQLALEMQKPERLEACAVPTKVQATEQSGAAVNRYGLAALDLEAVEANHKLMTDLLVMALACNQTKVFNMVFSAATSLLHTAGADKTHHELSHNEAVDPMLGYQPNYTHITVRSIEAWGNFVGALAAVKEGDGRLLDNTLVYAHSDTCVAKAHTLDNLPVMFAGQAGGRIKTGLHVAGNGSPVTRAGLTAMAAMHVGVQRWGTKSMETEKVISEVLV